MGNQLFTILMNWSNYHTTAAICLLVYGGSIGGDRKILELLSDAEFFAIFSCKCHILIALIHVSAKRKM